MGGTMGEQGLTLRDLIDKEGGVAKILILVDKHTSRTVWVWIDPKHPRYNLDKFNLDEYRWLGLATIP